MKATEKELKKAAKELNELGFEPAWNPKGSTEDTVKWLANAVKFLEADDVLTEETQAVVDELKAAKVPAKKEVPAPKGKKVPIVEEEEEEAEEVPEPEEEVEEEVVAPKKGKKAPVVEDAEEEEEVPAAKPAKGKKEVPAPKAKPAKAEKAAKAPKAKKEKTISPTYLVRFAVCENPGISIAELFEVLKKAGADMAPISISLRKNEMVAAIAILKAQGQLKK